MNTIKDNLLKNFIEDLYIEYDRSSIDEILNENITNELIHSSNLRQGDSFKFYSLPLYVICRLIKPEIVIETGTQNGASAQAILCALEKNNFGRLYSIDSWEKSTDDTHVLTIGKPGEKITHSLKQRWNLNIGFSYDILPNLLKELGKVDLFFHDSDHSKKCVEFEFNEIIKFSNEKSLIGLHDHYDQWDHTNILKNFRQIIGSKHPNVHQAYGQYHNVLRLWKLK